jgi:hypothetical protein
MLILEQDGSKRRSECLCFFASPWRFDYDMAKSGWMKVSLNGRLDPSLLAVFLVLLTALSLGVPFGADHAVAGHASRTLSHGGAADKTKGRVQRILSKSARTPARGDVDERADPDDGVIGHKSLRTPRRSNVKLKLKSLFSRKKDAVREDRRGHDLAEPPSNQIPAGTTGYGIPSNSSNTSSVGRATTASVRTEKRCGSCRGTRKSSGDSMLDDSGGGRTHEDHSDAALDPVRSSTRTSSLRSVSKVDAETQTDPPMSRRSNWWHNLRLWKWASAKFGSKSRKSARARYDARERFGVTEALAEKGELEKAFPQLKDFRTDPDINVLWEGGNRMRRALEVPRASVSIERIVYELKKAGHGFAGRGVGVVVNRYGQILKDKKGMPEHEEFVAENKNGQIYFVNLTRPTGFARANQFHLSEALEYQVLLPIDRPYTRAKTARVGVGSERTG